MSSSGTGTRIALPPICIARATLPGFKHTTIRPRSMRSPTSCINPYMNIARPIHLPKSIASSISTASSGRLISDKTISASSKTWRARSFFRFCGGRKINALNCLKARSTRADRQPATATHPILPHRLCYPRRRRPKQDPLKHPSATRLNVTVPGPPPPEPIPPSRSLANRNTLRHI